MLEYLNLRLAMALEEVKEVPMTQPFDNAQGLGETQIYEYNSEGQPRIFQNQMEDGSSTLPDPAESTQKESETPEHESPSSTTAARADVSPTSGTNASDAKGDDNKAEGAGAAAPACMEVVPVQPKSGSDLDADSEIEETTRPCKQCGVAHPVLDMIERNPEQFVCKGCHCISTTLRRHLAWPPREFQSLSLEEQQNFWLEAARTKAAGESTFRYDRIRDVLRQRLVTRKINASKREVGGTYKPISVLRKKGYILPQGFEENAPREWSEGLNAWTYLLPEITVNEGEVKESIEETLLECERQVKKRKVQGQGPAVATASASAASASAPQPICYDLVSDDEEEGKPKDAELDKQGGVLLGGLL